MDREQIIKNVVEEVAEENGIQNCDIELSKATEKGDNFLGEVFLVKVADKNTQNKLDLVAKLSIGNEALREKAPIRDVYENESYFYTKIFPALNQLQKEANIPHPFNSIAKLYKCSMDNLKEVLIMENLRTSSFELFDKTKFLDADHIKKIFEEYAKFHALSYALKEKKPEMFEEIRQNLKTVFAKFEENDLFIIAINQTFDNLISLCDNDEKFKDILQKCRANVTEWLCSNDVLKESQICILHGDCWSNNMMFKYQEINGNKKLTDIKIIDWQLCKIGSPVQDLSYALYSGAPKLVYQNLDHFLEIYRSILLNYFTALGGNPKNLITLETLRKHWLKYTKYSVIFSLLVMRIKLTKKEDTRDHTDYDPSKSEEESAAEFAEIKCDTDALMSRVKDLLMHVHELGVI